MPFYIRSYLERSFVPSSFTDEFRLFLIWTPRSLSTRSKGFDNVQELSYFTFFLPLILSAGEVNARGEKDVSLASKNVQLLKLEGSALKLTQKMVVIPTASASYPRRDADFFFTISSPAGPSVSRTVLPTNEPARLYRAFRRSALAINRRSVVADLTPFGKNSATGCLPGLGQFLLPQVQVPSLLIPCSTMRDQPSSIYSSAASKVA